MINSWDFLSYSQGITRSHFDVFYKMGLPDLAPRQDVELYTIFSETRVYTRSITINQQRKEVKSH